MQLMMELVLPETRTVDGFISTQQTDWRKPNQSPSLTLPLGSWTGLTASEMS